MDYALIWYIMAGLGFFGILGLAEVVTIVADSIRRGISLKEAWEEYYGDQ